MGSGVKPAPNRLERGERDKGGDLKPDPANPKGGQQKEAPSGGWVRMPGDGGNSGGRFI